MQVVENAKREVTNQVGTVLTDMNAKLRDMDNGLLKLTEAGKAIVDKLEAEKAETITVVQGFVGEASSEFGKHRAAIESVATEVRDTQKNIASMTAGLRDELDDIRAQMGRLQTAVASGAGTTLGDSAMRTEMEVMKGEVQSLKLSEASRGSAAARVGGGGGRRSRALYP